MSSYAEDVRRLLINSENFLAGSKNPNKVVFKRPITVDNGECSVKPGVYDFYSAERNSQAGRIRLFTKDHRPIEISHCNESNLFYALRDYSNELDDAKKQQQYAELKVLCDPYKGKVLADIISELGVAPNYFDKEEKMVWDAWLQGDENINYVTLHKTIQVIENIRDAKKRFDGVDPETLPIDDRIHAYHLGRICNKEGYREMEDLWETARDYGEEVPVWDDIWSSQYEKVLAMLKKLNIKRFYMISRSTALMEQLHLLMNNGWRISKNLILHRVDYYRTEYMALELVYVGE